MRKYLMQLMLVFVFGAGSVVWAANTDNPVDGVFKSAAGDTITIEVPSNVSKSPDALPGDLDFQVNSNTGYRGFNQLTDLKTGDPVKVEYKVDQRTKRSVAVMVSRADNVTTTTTTNTTTTSENVAPPAPAAVSDSTTTTTSTSY